MTWLPQSAGLWDLQPPVCQERPPVSILKRGGLGVAIDILFRTMLIEVPDMKNFYLALVNDIDRSEALKLIKHKEAIHISQDILMGAMSMQR